MQQKITPPQLKKIHVLLNQLGLMDSKLEIIYNATNGKCTSIKELSKYEATLLLEKLSRYDGNDKMRKKVFALAYDIGIIWGDTAADKRMNVIKLNNFLLSKGTVKKDISGMTTQELIKTVNQFEMIIKHRKQTDANKATKNLLDELNISVQKTTNNLKA